MRFLLILIMGVFMFMPNNSNASRQETAIVAGGCFWCIESDYDKLDGVISTVSGYIGGSVEDAIYNKVSHGVTAHYEAVKIVFDADKISYGEILDYFWRHIDPFDAEGQFCDKGDQYRAAIFFSDEKQKEIALASKVSVVKILGRDVVTEILSVDVFYDAEDYHQNYHNTNPQRYKFYRWSCGRDKKVKAIWKNL